MTEKAPLQGIMFDIDEVVVASTPLQIQAEQVTAQDMVQRYNPAAAYNVLRNGSEHVLG